MDTKDSKATIFRLSSDPRIAAKGVTFRGGQRPRLRVSGEFTTLDVGTEARRYKLLDAYRQVRNLEFRSLDKLTLETMKDHVGRLDLEGLFKLDADLQRRPAWPADEGYRTTRTERHYGKGLLLVLVNRDIYATLTASIDQYVLDVGREGYWAEVYTVAGGSAEKLRAFIHEKRPVGALLVGSLPVAFYLHDGSEFPCDLFLMDRGGTWTRPAADQPYDAHTGNVDPEVWVARLHTPTAGGNDADLLRDYFARNHRFRAGGLGHAYGALAYVDDDWGFGDCAFDELFPASAITTITDPTTTDADRYKSEVQSLRSWVQLCAHSWVEGHALKVGDTNEYIDGSYFRDTNSPNAHFYNLFCCGPGRFTTAEYAAGWYLFDQRAQGTQHGLCAVASAKSGSMLAFEDFYRPMGQGKVIGDAYREWWLARGPDHDDGEKYWYYGLVLLGDPTLNWWLGAVPQPIQPQPDDTFDHWPRRLEFRWTPVDIPGVRYDIEVDAIWAVNGVDWGERDGTSWASASGLTSTRHVSDFPGKQRGRWRVRADVGGRKCRWSEWSYFQFTV